MWNIAIIAFATATAVADLKWRKIPRGLTAAGLLVGLVINAFKGQIASSLSAALLGFGIGLALFSLGAIGGGDVKLIAALGAMLGLKPWALAMYGAVVVAALMAIVQIIRRQAVWQVLINLSALFRHFFKKGFKPHPTLNVHNTAAVRSPFGVAAGIGTVFAMLANTSGPLQFLR
jgi:prepilin peptidase CpaA